MSDDRRGGFLISRVSRAMGKKFQSLMNSVGLEDIGNGEGRLIYLLWRGGSMRQGILASKAGIDKSTLALTLSRMERKGFVDRKVDENDNRAVIVSLSANIVARASAFDTISLEMTELFYRGIEAEEITRFEATLERILSNLEGDESTQEEAP